MGPASQPHSMRLISQPFFSGNLPLNPTSPSPPSHHLVRRRAFLQRVARQYL